MFAEGNVDVAEMAVADVAFFDVGCEDGCGGATAGLLSTGAGVLPLPIE